MLDGCVVIEDFDVRYNQDRWQNFVELAEAGAETAVTVVHYTEEESETTYIRYTLTGGTDTPDVLIYELEYGVLKEGMKGVLTYQGRYFVSFDEHK